MDLEAYSAIGGILPFWRHAFNLKVPSAIGGMLHFRGML